MIDLICTTCQKPFKRKNSIHNINLKRGTKNFYCSIKCNPKSSLDELSPFRYLLNNVKRGRADLIDLDEQFLKELYNKQGGKCAITGLNMYLRLNTTKGEKMPMSTIAKMVGKHSKTIRQYSKRHNLSIQEAIDHYIKLNDIKSSQVMPSP